MYKYLFKRFLISGYCRLGTLRMNNIIQGIS